MNNILIHGLGQNEYSWCTVLSELQSNKIAAETPNLFKMVKYTKINYSSLFQKFADYCNGFEGKLNLCGLSLGGLLALDFAKKFPDKVNSLIIIGTPYKIPKFLFKLQGTIFHLMRKSTFEKMGCAKKDFISLVDSMAVLDIAKDLDKVECLTLILCGVKDSQNINSGKLLNENINNSEFKIIQDASHEVNVDNPKGLSEVIYDFWNEIL